MNQLYNYVTSVQIYTVFNGCNFILRDKWRGCNASLMSGGTRGFRIIVCGFLFNWDSVKLSQETCIIAFMGSKTTKRIRSLSINSKESIDFEQHWTVGEFPVRSEIDRQQSEIEEKSQ